MHTHIHVFTVSVFAGDVQEKGREGEAQSHDRIHQEAVSCSTSLPAHPRRCQFYGAEMCRGLFLDKTQRATPLSAKYFCLKNA